MAQKVQNKTKSAEKLLVICIDRDNDIGDKANIKTPVLGRDSCIEAAQRLALEDPEDADSNSMFAAIKMYEDLISRGNKAEVAIVAGLAERGVAADRKVAAEIHQLKKTFPATGAVIVSDGEDDESVIPVVQGILPVVSVKRVVMKVSRTIEYSYAVLGKYLKMLAYDPKYSKFFLGLPGILLLIGSIGSIFGYTNEIFAVLIMILGGALLMRAFDIDKVISHWTHPMPAGVVRIFTIICGVVIVLSSVPAGLNSLNMPPISVESNISLLLTDKYVLSQFIAGALPMVWIGIGAILGGALLSNILAGLRQQTGDILRLVVLGSLFPIVYQFNEIVLHDQNSFTLIPPLLAGLAAILVAAAVLYGRQHRHENEPSPKLDV